MKEAARNRLSYWSMGITDAPVEYTESLEARIVFLEAHISECGVLPVEYDEPPRTLISRVLRRRKTK